MTKVKRNHKDTMFRLIFKEKENLLSLYNAVNQTHYTNVEDLQINTLENAVYMNMKNDISFVFDFQLYLFEHQSTVNPNMPLRDLFYVAKVLQNVTKDEDLYSSKQKKIPTPRFVVFYNGVEPMPKRWTISLSEAFEQPTDNPELELTVTVFNINQGNNPELMDACKVLKDYAVYVRIVRAYSETMPLEEAVEKAIEECIKKDILADFLKKNRAEAMEVCLYEYNEELHLKEERDIAREAGIEYGMKIGQKRGEEIGRKRGEEIGRKRGEEIGRKRGEEIGQKRGEEIGQKRGEEIGQKRGEEIGRKRGEEIGQKRGEEIGQERVNALNCLLAEKGRIQDILEAAQNPEYQKKLLEEFEL